MNNFKNLINDENGATAVEYGLIIAAIAGAIILTVFALGDSVNRAFQSVDSRFPTAQ